MGSAANNPNRYFEKILNSIVDFLLISGLEPSEIKRQVDKRVAPISVVSAKKNGTGSGVAEKGIETVSAVVLHRWFREPKLLDSSARPRPLRLYGRAPSVESLVRSECPGKLAKQIVRTMRAAGLISRGSRGQYTPRSRVATISTLHPVLVEHVSKSLIRFLETVKRNTSSSRSEMRLIERFTHIPDLPRKDLQAFANFSQEHGSAFLAGVDDWLESRREMRRKSPSSGGRAAGIHVFAYVEASPRRNESTTPRPRGATRA